MKLRVSIAACALAGAVLQAAPPSRLPQGDTYADVVAQFATAPNAATERMLAMNADAVAEGVRAATRAGSGWTAEMLDRALLMHGDAIVSLASQNSPGLDRQIGLASELAMAAAGWTGNPWFVHRWYKAVTARVHGTMLDAQWRKQRWYRDAAAIDRGRELETDAGQEAMHMDVVVHDPGAFKQAIPLFEQGVAAHLLAAAVHLGRIQMLRGEDEAGKRLLRLAEVDETSRVNRYLAHLFLGSFEERDMSLATAERHYRDALSALPRAQSGRFALAAVLVRRGHDDTARLALVDRGATPFYDPWWSYFHGTDRDSAYTFAELHAEVCR